MDRALVYSAHPVFWIADDGDSPVTRVVAQAGCGRRLEVYPPGAEGLPA